jgi:hypothetical protein
MRGFLRLESVFFLSGRVVGQSERNGSGFYVRASDGIFAITSAQAIRDGHTVLKSTGADSHLETRAEDWWSVDPDIGVYRVDGDSAAIPIAALATQDMISAQRIGEANSVITVVSDDGREALLRFGSISSVDAGLVAVDQRGPIAMPGALAVLRSMRVLGISDGMGHFISPRRITQAIADTQA